MPSDDIVEAIIEAIRNQADLITNELHGELWLKWQDGRVMKPVKVTINRTP